MHTNRILIIALATSAIFGSYLRSNGAEKDDKYASTIEKAIKDLKSAKKLSLKDISKKYTSTTGKILDLSPCNASVPGGNVMIEMTTELYASSSESKSILFIEYLFCVNKSTGQLILKQADSILLAPGTGVCGLPCAELNNLDSGNYLIIGQVNTRNPDDSETVQDRKTCEFSIP